MRKPVLYLCAAAALVGCAALAPPADARNANRDVFSTARCLSQTGEPIGITLDTTNGGAAMQTVDGQIYPGTYIYRSDAGTVVVLGKGAVIVNIMDDGTGFASFAGGVQHMPFACENFHHANIRN